MSNVKETLDETVGLYDKWSDRYKILHIKKKKENGNACFEAGSLRLFYMVISQSSANICHCGNSISGITAVTRLIVDRSATKLQKNELLTKKEKWTDTLRNVAGKSILQMSYSSSSLRIILIVLRIYIVIVDLPARYIAFHNYVYNSHFCKRQFILIQCNRWLC